MAFFALLTYALCSFAFIIDLSSIFFILNVWTHRKHQFVKARKPELSYSILWIYFSVLLLAICNVLIYFILKKSDYWDIKYFFLINDGIQYAVTLAYATRAWILFYHVEWSYESVNHIWRTQMSNHTSNETDTPSTKLETNSSSKEDAKLLKKSLFYINNRETLGNSKKVFPVLMGVVLPLLLLLLNILPLFILNINDGNQYYILRTIHICVYIIILSITYYFIYKIHQISDKYFIAHELSRITFSLGIFIIIGRIIGDFIFHSLKYPNLVVFINSFCTILGVTLVLFFSTFWVLRKLITEFSGRDTLKSLEQSLITRILTMCLSSSQSPFAEQEKKQKNKTIHELTMNQVLNTKTGFETLTQFLISELSVENMLFLVEVKQYKARCRQFHKIKASQSNGKPNLTIPNGKTNLALPNGKNIMIHASSENNVTNVASLRPTTSQRDGPSVFNSRSVMDVGYLPKNDELQELDPYDYAMYLYTKYVKRGSDLQINIASKTYKLITNFLIKKNKNDITSSNNYIDNMFQLYDKAWEEIFRLIDKDSFSRYRDTKDYEYVCKDYIKEQEIQKKKKKKERESIKQHTQGLLEIDWNDDKMTIVEDEEVDYDDNKEEDDDEMADQLNSLHSIKNYNSNNKDDDMMDQLNSLHSIQSYDSTNKDKENKKEDVSDNQKKSSKDVSTQFDEDILADELDQIIDFGGDDDL